MQNGNTGTALGEYGGGIFNQGTLTLVNVKVEGNTACSGADIANYNSGNLTMTGGSIIDNATTDATGLYGGGGLLNFSVGRKLHSSLKGVDIKT